MQLSDFINKKVVIVMRDVDDYEGTLIEIDDRGYFLEDSDRTVHYIPDNNNVISIDYEPN